MNKFKKALSMMLAIVLMVTGITFTGNVTTKADSATDSWKNTAITSPKQNSLIGAGYIDIKWNNTLEDVSNYQVFVDGQSKAVVAPTGAQQMSCEFYTTNVSGHTAYIVATLKNGTKVTTSVRTFYVTKKGLCVDENMGQAVDPAALNIGWYYNWGEDSFEDIRNSQSGNGKFKNTKFDNVEFVPMIWGDKPNGVESIFEKSNNKGYKYMLTYNEPNEGYNVGGSNMSISLTAERWFDCWYNKGNMRLGSPALSVFPTWSNDWWVPFWSKLNDEDKSHMTFIALHSYQKSYSGPESALQYLHAVDECWAKYRKPIWITEFAFWRFSKNDKAGSAKAQEFMKIVLKGLNERSYVERYSWFCPDSNSNDASSSSIFEYATGNITPIGKIYAQIGNPAGYNAKTYGVNSSTSINTSESACVASLKTFLYQAKPKKKAFKYKLKAVSNASGYQIQYSTKKNMKSSKKKTVKKLSGTIKIKFTKKQKKQIKKKKLKKIKYYVRARAFKKMNGKTYYCAWSSKISCKVKTK